jgi:hypothetical protein
MMATIPPYRAADDRADEHVATEIVGGCAAGQGDPE